MRKPIKPCLVGLLSGLLTVTLSVAVAEEPAGPPEPVPIRMQANPLTANTAPTFVHPSGKATTDFGSGDNAKSVVLQPDGKIVVAGSSNYNFALASYLADGTLDSSFGTGGQVISDFGWTEMISSVTLQKDGKIIAAGTRGYDFILARYLPNGVLDNNFGFSGMVILDLGSADFGQSVVIQPDGKILVGGSSNANFALVRFQSDGTLDTSFGLGGQTIIDFGSSDYARSVVLQPDGKIVVAGSSNFDFALARHLPNGMLDSSFGYGGKIIMDLGSYDYAGSATLQPDGKILVAGYSNFNFAVARFLPNGMLDTNFGSAGKAMTDLGSTDSGESVILQPDGKILVAGFRYEDFALVRYLSDGTLDNSFGFSGRVMMDFGSTDRGESLALQPDGKILMTGSAIVNGNDNFALVRYLEDGSLDTSFGTVESALSYQPRATEQKSEALGPYAKIIDVELAAIDTYDGATLTIGRQIGANPEDLFSAKSGGSLSGLTPSSYFAVDGITIGRVITNSGGNLQLQFLGANATQARVDKAMQQIAYTNTSDRPPAQVLIDWTFDDGNTGAQGTGGALSTTGTVTVNISPQNDWPLLVKSPPPQTAVANIAFSYTLPADTFNDPDDDPLTWNLAMADGTGLPPWLSFNPATRLLSGTPTEFDIGNLNLRIIVKDPANASAEAYMNLRVTAVTNTSGLNASILPTARSVQIGQPATAFGTLINTTGLDAWNCYLAIPPDASIPGTFTYQTTNDSNQLIGTVNTSIDISAGSAQNFVFGITPNAAFNTTDIPIVFDCANTVPAPSQAGLNTFLLSASSTPAPDMVAIGATPSGDGVLRVPGSTGVDAFGTAAVNIGATGTITVTADTGGVSLPLTLTLCQTNPGTGGCLAPPAASVSSSIGNQQVATYAVFAQATGAIAFDPSANRIFLRLSSGGVVRGGTSVAVTTE